MLTNIYSGKCQSCSLYLEPNVGFVFKQNNKWKHVCNSTACHKQLGLTQLSSKRYITESGDIFMDYDKQALPIIKALAKAKWNPNNKSWNVSIDKDNIKRVVAVCKQLNIEIPDKLISLSKEESIETIKAKERADTASLYEFQKLGVEFLASKTSALLADDMGLGKTLQTLIALPQNSKVIIVCPASLKYNWQDEIIKWKINFKSKILSGENSFCLPIEGECVIINYDILPEWLEQPLSNEIKLQLSSTYLIADEAHLLKNYNTKRHKRFKTLSENVYSCWLLTGTPLMNRPQDLYGVLSAGQMNVFGSWQNFCRLFNGYKNKFGGYVFGTPIPEVSERLKNVMLRRLKSEVLKDLPSKQYQTITINNTGEVLQKELDEAWSLIDEEDYNLPSFELFSLLRAKLAESRIPAMMDFVNSYEESNTPLCIFSAHKAPILHLKDREGWGIITGETSSIERRDIVKSFQDGKLKGIALTIQSGGVGLTLTRASHALFVDLDWTPALNLQAEDRLCRIGAKADHILIMHMQSNHVLDKHVQLLISRKMDLIRKSLENSYTYEYSNKNLLKEETDEELALRLTKIKEVENKVIKDLAKEKVSSILEREQNKSKVTALILSIDRKNVIKQAFDYMLTRCDGAKNKDFQGFNKPDACIAKWILETGLEENDDITFKVLERILSRYYGQLNSLFPLIWSYI